MIKSAKVLVCAILFTGTLTVSPKSLSQDGFPGAGRRADWLKANGLYAEGNQLMEHKKYAEAAAAYQAAVEAYPHDPHYFFNLGLALKHQGQLSPAENAFVVALKLNGRDWRCWKVLGNCKYQRGDYEGAKEAFLRALNNSAPSRECPELKAGVAACSAHLHSHQQ